MLTNVDKIVNNSWQILTNVQVLTITNNVNKSQ